MAVKRLRKSGIFLERRRRLRYSRRRLGVAMHASPRRRNRQAIPLSGAPAAIRRIGIINRRRPGNQWPSKLAAARFVIKAVGSIFPIRSRKCRNHHHLKWPFYFIITARMVK